MKKEITESAPKPLLIAEQQAQEAVRLVQITREPAAPQNPIVAAIEKRFTDGVLDVNDFRGDLAVTIRPDRITEVCRALKEDPATKFDLLSSITGARLPGLPRGEERRAVQCRLSPLLDRSRPPRAAEGAGPGIGS